MLNHLSTKQLKKRLLRLYTVRLAGLFLIPFVLLGFFPDVVQSHITRQYLAGFFIILLGLWIVYYCAFEKRGTRWLSFCIWVTILGYAVEAIGYMFTFIGCCLSPQGFYAGFIQGLKEGFPGLELESIVPFFITNSLITVAFMAIGILTFYFYIVLRKRNNLYQYKVSLKETEYRQAYAQIDSASSPEELEIIYRRLSREFYEIRKLLRFKYLRRKTCILNNGSL